MNVVKNGDPEVSIDKWAAISGQWTFPKGNAKYHGQSPKQTDLYGMARASNRFRDGTISTTIKFQSVEDSAAGLFYRYQSSDAPFARATIGGFGRAYSILEYHPGRDWTIRAAAGSSSNLSATETYCMSVSIAGQSVRLTVNDVDVLNATLSIPLEGSGMGLYTYGKSEISFSNTTISGDAPKVFVMMPFAEPFDSLYQQVINPVAARLGFEVTRVDEVVGPGIIIDDIQRQIENSHAVVAEISTQNPNVFYELGYAHALRKPAILLVRRSDSAKMPFDIRGYSAIFYDDSISGKNMVERNLQQHLNAILAG